MKKSVLNRVCLVQVSERERQVNLDSKFHEIVQMVTEKTVNPETQRPYPVTTIEQSLRDAHFAIKANRNAKQLALEAIRLLKGEFVNEFMVKIIYFDCADLILLRFQNRFNFSEEYSLFGFVFTGLNAVSIQVLRFCLKMLQWGIEIEGRS